MSNRANQQRRVARRFKRHLRVITQHHQRGRVDVGLAVMLTVFALLSAAVIYACILMVAQSKREQTRIDWSAVPVLHAPVLFCDLRSTRSPCITTNQAAFKRERQRMYAALAFERSRPQ